MHKINIKELSKYLKNRSDVICAVIFGSAQDGVVKDGSDLDLGVYFSEQVKGDALIRFMVEVAEAADFDVIDLVDLRSAEPVLAFEVISGNFICKNDPEKTAELFSLICRKYEEVMFRLNSAA